MFKYIVRFILRQRLGIIITIAIITAFMGYKALNIKLSYEMAQMLPETDSTFINYKKFKNTFGEDGAVLFIGIQDKGLFELDKYNDWYDLSYELKKIHGVQEVVSIAKIYTLLKNDNLKKFEFKNIIPQKPKTQEEVDKIKNEILSLPLYNELVYNKKNSSTIMAITLDKKSINNKNRITLINNIKNTAEKFSKKNNIDLHYSGLPYIRTITSTKIKTELILFVVLALLIAAIVLFLFFRSFKSVLPSITIVIISVIWAMGIIVLLGYEITFLTGIIPPLLIIIGVENCIFLINKYHLEYKTHGNKVKALSRVISRVGPATLLTNLTTAAGFAAFIITRNKILVEFGVVATINIIIIYILTILLIPIFNSYFDPPNIKNTKHLDNATTNFIIAKITNLILNHRTKIYIISICLSVIGIYGVTKLKTTGKIVDDISTKSDLYKDLIFLQKQVKGILPFEISIDTKKDKGVMRLSTLKKIDKLQKILAEYPEFSKPLSIVEVAKTAKQAFYKGDTSMYSLPNSQEKNFILSYLPDQKLNKKTILTSFVDTNMRYTRITIQMSNIGTTEIQKIKDELRPKIDSIFSPAKYNVTMTGKSIVFLKGTNYMIKNLIQSLLLAILIIILLMALLFSSAKMITISFIPNILPQLLTAALMGFVAISIKPSTILIFSVALGISVDNAIHFLSRYRFQLKLNNNDIKKSVIMALNETSYSMIYSSIVLFLGFGIFIFSDFGGTQAVGFLIPFTLFIAVLSNLILLPSLLLTLDKKITTKAFKEPLLEIFDEEEDIDLEELDVKK